MSKPPFVVVVSAFFSPSLFIKPSFLLSFSGAVILFCGRKHCPILEVKIKSIKIFKLKCSDFILWLLRKYIYPKYNCKEVTIYKNNFKMSKMMTNPAAYWAKDINNKRKIRHSHQGKYSLILVVQWRSAVQTAWLGCGPGKKPRLAPTTPWVHPSTEESRSRTPCADFEVISLILPSVDSKAKAPLFPPREAQSLDTVV